MPLYSAKYEDARKNHVWTNITFPYIATISHLSDTNRLLYISKTHIEPKQMEYRNLVKA